jgi:hypothetical protein
MEIVLRKSNKPEKKWMVDVEGKRVHFGSSKYEDYTMHNDKERKWRYLVRHRKNERWGKSGILTSGFYSRWLLWNKKTIDKSIKDIEKKFNLKIKRE